MCCNKGRNSERVEGVVKGMYALYVLAYILSYVGGCVAVEDFIFAVDATLRPGAATPAAFDSNALANVPTPAPRR